MDSYEVLEEIGDGACSVVYLGKDKESGKRVALKDVYRIKNSKDYAKSEVEVLSKLRHENIVHLVNHFSANNKTTLVLEYYPYDLYGLMKSGDLKSMSHIKYYLLQVLKAVDYCHRSGFIHRDIKPENVLIDGDGRVVLSDFGLAIASDVSPEGSYVPGTRWYRAPEFMLGSKAETFAADYWAVGCLFAQLLNFGDPIFKGISDIDHLCQIFNILGSPNDENWPSFSELPEYGRLLFNSESGVGLAAVLSDVPEETRSFLGSFLRLEPGRRLSAGKALSDPFFSSSPLPEPMIKKR
ncbi:hypothetical protein NDN08_003235 [Rhodosorus marinus]|uniref:Protein kinase domain-containing protein n=1 Tax=Rhodosorus marinus TaxID=101924 RepID=A0AAV8V1T1_9RHOD|nr:hypothetical protein NDN08_003235 [Rhodosorus marinus]